MNDLKTCPFCGSKAESFSDVSFCAEDGRKIAEIKWFVWCTVCSALVSGESKEEASEAWNRRASIEPEPLTVTIDYEPSKDVYDRLKQAMRDEPILLLPSEQPERTCVNCGRTVNNGGWYADGGTRCPIEEHYALPKDGYCHLWEKRNVTDDDYPERREE